MDSKERREKLNAMVWEDPDFRSAWEEYERTKNKFEKLVRWMPRKVRNILWAYPGMGYFLYQRMMDYVCEQMIFQNES